MPNYNFVSIIKSDQNDIFDDEDNNEYLNTSYIHLKLNISEARDGKITKIYNSQSSECDITNLKNGWKYKCLIHFNYIWFDSDKKRCGLSLDLTQLKIYQPSYLSKCLIDNNQPLSNQMHLMIPSQSNQHFLPTLPTQNTAHNNINNNVTNNINNSQTINNIKPIMVVPNAMELLNIKNALKKVV